MDERKAIPKSSKDDATQVHRQKPIDPSLFLFDEEETPITDSPSTQVNRHKQKPINPGLTHGKEETPATDSSSTRVNKHRQKPIDSNLTRDKEETPATDSSSTQVNKHRQKPANPNLTHDVEETSATHNTSAQVNRHKQKPTNPTLTYDAGKTPATDKSYSDSNEHLCDELNRVDYLIRAQTLLWRYMLAEHKPDNLWGMVHVTDSEIDNYLKTPFIPPGYIPKELQKHTEPYLQKADCIKQLIKEKCNKADITLRLNRLQHIFGLSDLGKEVLLICLLPELDDRYRRLYAYLLDDASRTQPTIGLIMQILRLYLLTQKAWAAKWPWYLFEASAPLIKHQLVRISEPRGEGPLLSRSIRIDDRIKSYLLGSDQVDARLDDVILQSDQAVSWQELVVDDDKLSQLQSLVQRLRESPTTLFLQGPYGSGRLKAARALCTAARLPLLTVDVSKALQGSLPWEALVELAYREALLQDAAIYWSNVELLLEDQFQRQWDCLSKASEKFKYPDKASEEFKYLDFLASKKSWDPAGRFQNKVFIQLNFPVPHYNLRIRLWECYLPPTEHFADPALNRSALAKDLANSFQFTEGQVLDALTTAYSEAFKRSPSAPYLTPADIYEGCRRQSSRKLIDFTRRIEPRTTLTFEDLILPETNKCQLEELRSRISHRNHVYVELGLGQRLSLGKGLIALFTGTSGTGKTMAAELLACEQGVDLYKVDLSAVVSKYVGETEKNLGRVFADAEDANAILFFDEADSIFGKRGEVKEAQDRWANMEVNYLLQRVEEYDGTVILASNLKQNIDEAFRRRIQVLVDFPFPDEEARLHIYKGMFPNNIIHPTDEELDKLARQFKLSGGSIKNVVVDAIFRAVASKNQLRDCEVRVKTGHLVLAIAREYQKLGKPLTKGEFGQEFYRLLERTILRYRS